MEAATSRSRRISPALRQTERVSPLELFFDLGLALPLLALVPLASEVDSLLAVTAVAAALWAMIAVETRNYGDARRELRAQVARGEA